MSTTDTFPIDPDYSVTRTRESNVLRGRVESAREYFRQKAPSRRVFDLVFSRRSIADWNSIENFRLKMMTDFFTFTDKTSNRGYSVYFQSEPVYEEAGNEQVNIRLQLIEAAGAEMADYPSFAAGNPFATLDVSQAADLGTNGRLFIYAGYGYRVNGSYDAIYLDETQTDGESLNTEVPLALHPLRVVGGTPNTLDYLI